MKSLSRDAIQRMVTDRVGGGGGGAGGGGLDPSALSGYATRGWVNQNYLSIEFFSKLFKAYDSSNPAVEITPNDTESTITNIKAMFGFWTNQYISALGQNSGGGGGGASALTDLVDVAISSPTNGQALVYNATSQKWENQTIGGGSGTLTSIGLVMPTGFSVSPATLTADGSFTVSFTNGYALPTTADVNKGVTAYGWGNHANAGYLTSSDISDMATKTWVSNQNYLTSVAFSDLTNHPTTLSGYGINDAMNSSTTFWGQSVSNGSVTGNMSSVGSITMNGIIFNDGNYLLFKSSVNAVGLMIEGGMTESGVTRASFGFHPAQSSNVTAWWENKLLLQLKQSSSEAFVDIPNGILQIGNGRLIWDSTNNALKVQKADGTAANFYATGGVSALGANSGSAGSIANLTITDTLTFANSSENESGSITVNVNGLVLSSSTQEICINGDLFVGNDCYSTYSHADRFYLDSSRYIYLDSGVLKYYDNGTVRTIAFS